MAVGPDGRLHAADCGHDCCYRDVAGGALLQADRRQQRFRIITIPIRDGCRHFHFGCCEAAISEVVQAFTSTNQGRYLKRRTNMFSKKKEDETGPDGNPAINATKPRFFVRWTGRLFLIGIGAVGGCLAANHWRSTPERDVLSVLTVMDQKLDLIWRRTSAGTQSAQNTGYDGAVMELPAIPVNGGSINLRFKRVGDAYHYECSIEGTTDAISRLIAPNGKSVLLKATFADKDNFDLTDLTLSGHDFVIKEEGDGPNVALYKQGVWENNVDPDQIKNWRIEVLDRETTETKVGAVQSPTPNGQVQDLAADITVHPITGKLILPESLQEIQNRLAQATPTPSPQPPRPTFQDPPSAMPAPAGSVEPNVKVEEPRVTAPKPTPAETPKNS
jgi:(2Fe-2S) ferredoxin